MKNFTSVQDVQDINALALEGLSLKQSPFSNKAIGENKTLGLIFFNPSLRTRLSSQKAAQNLGMELFVMNIDKEGWRIETEMGVLMDGDKAEHIKEAAGVISQYCDVLGIRSFPGLTDRNADYSDHILQSFLDFASVPIVSLESATRHPLQSLADLMTIKEHQTNAKPKVVLTWAPHPRALPQAVPNSFAEWMNQADVDLVITHPEGYELDEQFVGNATVSYQQDEALQGADFVYAKNWSSFQQYGKILSTDSNWTITREKMALTNQGKFMHCLPVRRNMIVSDAVIDSPASLVLEQANNRTFAMQAVLKSILESN
ncbi:N-acetylornithine carbamoyltransferase [Rapidithrix thailandica]|uniref:N-succinylornithine carbamoyltransferase n=1 Tax=Rapidithrix thailandica TaxID=413964 RepID=A0AAW9S316_9BACT